MAHGRFISIIAGIMSMAGLFLFYAMTMKFLAGSWNAVWWQFRQLWYLMVPLMAGFGIQVGLFSYIKFSDSHATSNKMMAANSAVSTVGMVACCAHHTVDIAPLLGISALSFWLMAYQKELLLIGIISNLIGVFYLLKIIKNKH